MKMMKKTIKRAIGKIQPVPISLTPVVYDMVYDMTGDQGNRPSTKKIRLSGMNHFNNLFIITMWSTNVISLISTIIIFLKIVMHFFFYMHYVFVFKIHIFDPPSTRYGLSQLDFYMMASPSLDFEKDGTKSTPQSLSIRLLNNYRVRYVEIMENSC